MLPLVSVKSSAHIVGHSSILWFERFWFQYSRRSSENWGNDITNWSQNRSQPFTVAWHLDSLMLSCYQSSRPLLLPFHLHLHLQHLNHLEVGETSRSHALEWPFVSRLCKHNVILTSIQRVSTSSVISLRGLCAMKVKKDKKKKHVLSSSCLIPSL